MSKDWARESMMALVLPPLVGVSSPCKLNAAPIVRRRLLFSVLFRGLCVPRPSSKYVVSCGSASSQICEADRPGKTNFEQDNGTTENGSPQPKTSVDIPVTCYQILGVLNQAEKDEVVKSVMELRNAELEDGYSLDAMTARKELLMDVRDKLLFEPEYAGNIKDNIPPRSSIRIPWAWFPGALCLLQEAGEEKLVIQMGRAALQHPDAQPYVHDLLLSMALAECSVAKNAFELGKVSQGFEALARGQHMLRTKKSLEEIPLLTHIEESLEELAPACTLELLSMPQTPENIERRHGAVAALREFLRQGLEIETSCTIEDWPSFLHQSMNKLMASEIVDLLSWDALAVTRKNKKSLESQNQRVVIDFTCFYTSLLAHIALGFSNRDTDLINKSKTICDCLQASEGIHLQLEESLCAFLLGMESEKGVVENLQLFELNKNPSPHKVSLGVNKDYGDSTKTRPSLEKWLKDSVLGLFPDTRDCSPALANFFAGDKKIRIVSKQKKRTDQFISNPSGKSSSYLPSVAPRTGASKEPFLKENSQWHLGSVTRQLAPAGLQSHHLVGDGHGSDASSLQMNRKIDMSRKQDWRGWWAVSENKIRPAVAALVFCVIFTTFQMFHIRFGWKNGALKLKLNAFAWTTDHVLGPSVIHSKKDSILGKLRSVIVLMKNHLNVQNKVLVDHKLCSADDLSGPVTVSPDPGRMFHKRQMSLEEAEGLVKHWQAVKADALGPCHQLQGLPDILSESMLDQWKSLAETAKANSCFWRFVPLQLSILRADIMSDGMDLEVAEVDAELEEAAELVDKSSSGNQNYYSTYQVRYVLKRHRNGSWRFCGGRLHTPG